MASVAVFVCYLCNHVFTLSDKHFCQKECDTKTALHRDMCHRCMRTMISDMEAQLATTGGA